MESIELKSYRGALTGLLQLMHDLNHVIFLEDDEGVFEILGYCHKQSWEEANESDLLTYKRNLAHLIYNVREREIIKKHKAPKV